MEAGKGQRRGKPYNFAKPQALHSEPEPCATLIRFIQQTRMLVVRVPNPLAPEAGNLSRMIVTEDLDSKSNPLVCTAGLFALHGTNDFLIFNVL